MKYHFLSISLLFLAISISAQNQANLDYSENGYYWLSLHNPIPFSYPKHKYLEGILERYNILMMATNKDYLADCRLELAKLQKEGRSNLIDIDILVKAIDKFYSNQSNLSIQILDAYCYCIKEIAGLSKEELIKYRDELFKRYKN